MKILYTACLLLFTGLVGAQDATKGPTHLEIRTSTVCDMCVATIKENLIYEKGVERIDVDLATSTIHVDYNPRKNNPDALRLAVTQLGYYADDMPGDPAAFKKLPACCQKEGCGKPAEQK